MKLIETKTLGTAAASIEFTSIPQDGTDLVILISARSTRAAGADTGRVRFNGTTSGYSGRELLGTGSGVVTGTTATSSVPAIFPAASSTSNTFGNSVITIPNYTGATNKSISADVVTENNATEAFQDIVAVLWSNTAAITSIEVTTSNGDLVAGSTVSLYKVTKGSDGIVTTS
jgi:hypothetical protein